MSAQQEHQPRSQGSVRLTPAEARVLPLLATHLTLSAIADQLGVRRSTVKTHVASIYRKFGATTRAEAVERAQATGAL
jgi:LuxR family transcriptional regulator, maltose regulon positive regulatory protein